MLMQTPKFSEFPPNALQFKQLCKAHLESFRIPSLTEVEQEMALFGTHGKLSSGVHPIMSYIASRLPEHYFQDNRGEQDTARRECLSALYQKIRTRIENGYTIPPVSVLPEVRKPRSAEAENSARQHMNAIYTMLGVS